MIDHKYCSLMTCYNSWQNGSLVQAADRLTDADRREDRGAFFGSIFATFLHLLRDDALWLARFSGNPKPELDYPETTHDDESWGQFKTCRERLDQALIDWADTLKPLDLDGIMRWYPGGGSSVMERPAVLCAVHLFNHQTHHRGQIHAMLTAAGQDPGPTDLPVMP